MKLTIMRRRKDGSQSKLVFTANQIREECSVRTDEEAYELLLDAEMEANASGELRVHLEDIQPWDLMEEK